MYTGLLVASTTDPAFAVDLEGKILAWNGAAEEFFGHLPAEVLGRRCWEVLSGQDIFGNRYCSLCCPLIGMAKRQQAVHRCQLLFQTAAGEWSRVGVCTLVVPGENHSEAALVHHLCRTGPLGDEHLPASGALLNSKSRSPGLTPRETELLGLLREGKATREIAELLCISPATARSHIRHILRKLRAHSRLEAVALGQRLGLI